MENKVIYEIYRDECPDEYGDGDECILFKTVGTEEDAKKVVDAYKKLSVYDPTFGSNFMIQKYTVETSDEVDSSLKKYFGIKNLCVLATIRDYPEYKSKKFGEGRKFKLGVQRRLYDSNHPDYKNYIEPEVKDCSDYKKGKYTLVYVSFKLSVETLPQDKDEVLKLIVDVNNQLTDNKYDIKFVYDEYNEDNGITL